MTEHHQWRGYGCTTDIYDWDEVQMTCWCSVKNLLRIECRRANITPPSGNKSFKNIITSHKSTTSLPWSGKPDRESSFWGNRKRSIILLHFYRSIIESLIHHSLVSFCLLLQDQCTAADPLCWKDQWLPPAITLRGSNRPYEITLDSSHPWHYLFTGLSNADDGSLRAQGPPVTKTSSSLKPFTSPVGDVRSGQTKMRDLVSLTV